MCDTFKDGTVKAQEATIVNTILLVRKKMKQYNIDIDHVIRHFDVTGKHCPAYMMDEQAWAEFKARILGYQIGRTYKMVIASYLRKSPRTGNNKVRYDSLSSLMQKKCKRFGGYAKLNGSFTLVEVKAVGNDIWGKTKSGYWVSMKYKGIVRTQKITH